MKKPLLIISSAVIVLSSGFMLWWQPNKGMLVTTSKKITNAVKQKKLPAKNANTNSKNGSTNASTNTATNSTATTRGESHFGVHTGSLNFSATQPFVSELGSQIWVRDGAGLYRDEYGWGKNGYNNPSTRTPLPSVGPTRFLDFAANRYDDTEPSPRPISTYPTGHEQNYRAYVNYLLDAYADTLKYWEVNNEVDLSMFWAGTATDYANLVKLASNTIEPRCASCKVGVSFSSSNIGNQQFFSALGGICNSFDFFDIHAVSGLLMQPGDLDRWKRTCSGKEFISTESGVSDAPSGKSAAKVQLGGGSPDLQARDLAKYNTLLFAAGYNKIFWYLIDTDYGSLDIFLHNALVDENGTKKPAFTAYKIMIEKTDYFTSLAKLGDGQYKYTFADKDPIYVLWCDSGSCRLPSEISGQVTVTDYQGNATTRNASQVTLSASPVFVQ